jgi:uncharacterized membrane protein YidH (DUF202 family)
LKNSKLLLAEASLEQARDSDGHDNVGELAVPTEAMVRHEAMLINEVSLVLAEKRTSLSVMRTGLAILVLPLSVASVLIAISRYYDPSKVLFLLIPVFTINILLAVFGLYLILYSWRRSRTLDAISLSLKQQNSNLQRLCQLIEKDR